MEHLIEMPPWWCPDETVVVYEIRTGEGPEEVAGHRCGDFAVRHLFEALEVSDEADPSVRVTLPRGTWVVDHLPTNTMMFFHGSRALAAFVADNFAAHFEGHATMASLVAAAEPVNEWVVVSVHCYQRGMQPCSLNAWLRSHVRDLGAMLGYLPALRPCNVHALERVLRGLPADPEPAPAGAPAGTE